MRHYMQVRITIGIIGTLLVSSVFADVAERLKACVGASRVKMVWTRCKEGTVTGFPNSGVTQTEFLMRYDTETGKVDTLFDKKMQNYQKSLISRDGSKIIYTTFPDGGTEGEVYMVNWDDPSYPGMKIAQGFGGCLWYDESAKKEYVLYTFRANYKGEDPIYKIDINDTSDNKPFFNDEMREVNGQWFSVSSDAKTIIMIQGWPNVNLYDVGSNTRLGSQVYGCWASMPYDKSRRGVCLENNHKGWRLIDSTGKYTDYLQKDITLNNFRFASYSSDVAVCTFQSSSNDPGIMLIYKMEKDLSGYSDTVSMPTGDNPGKVDAFIDLWTPKDPDILFIAPSGDDTIRVGDTITVSWKYNDAYLKKANGASIKLSPDNGASWSDALRSIDGVKEDTAMTSIMTSSQAYGNARFVIPDSVVIGDEKTSTLGDEAFIRIEDYGNSELPKAKSKKLIIASGANEHVIRGSGRAYHPAAHQFGGTGTRVYDIQGRLVHEGLMATCGSARPGVYVVQEGNRTTAGSRRIVIR